MTAKKDLKPGSFYWVLPVFDHDLPSLFEDDTSDEAHEWRANHWSNKVQPAMFVGFESDGSSEAPRWTYLDVEEDWGWPVRWIGEELIPPTL
jgi:hypothetical protein